MAREGAQVEPTRKAQPLLALHLDSPRDLLSVLPLWDACKVGRKRHVTFQYRVESVFAAGINWKWGRSRGVIEMGCIETSIRIVYLQLLVTS
jgi:hypothetical protein